MRRAARIDANQPDIVAGLKRIGADVRSMASLGDNFPDILVGWRGRNFLIEIKDGDKPPSKRALSPGQKEFRDTWRGHTSVAYCLKDALHIIQEL